MRTKVKAFITVIGVLLFIAAISIIIISRGPLYGQPEYDNWVPDMIGTWTGEGAVYLFSDVTVPSQPEFFYISSLDRDIVITEQTGRVFAGAFGLDDEYKLTGVILKDRTVSIQYFEPSEERHFFTGRLTKSGNTLQISAIMQFFDDFNHVHPGFGIPPDYSDRMMASAYVQLVKID